MSDQHESSQAEMEIQSIATDEIRPNGINPNRMAPEQFAQLKREIQRIGSLPDPIYVRPVEGGFEIVDGEHRWRAARKLGMTHVPCYVQDVDDFELRRLLLKRNKHGTHNKIGDGQLYRDMMQAKDLSIRGLADELDISEATIRNRLQYLQVFERRVKHTEEPEQAKAEIEKNKISDIRTYNALPEAVANKALDANWLLLNYRMEEGRQIDEAGLTDLLDPDDFLDSWKRLTSCTNWRSRHLDIEDVDAYIRPVAELGLPANCLDCIPCFFDEDGECALAMTAKEWARMIETLGEELLQQHNPQEYLLGDLRHWVDDEIEDILDLRRAVKWEKRRHDPRFRLLAEAEHLTTSERAALAERCPRKAGEVALEALEKTVEHLRQLRGDGDGPDEDRRDDAESVFNSFILERYFQKPREEDEELFGDPDKLRQALLEQAREDESLAEYLINERPAVEAFEDWVEDLDHPACVLLTCGHRRGSSMDRFARWAQAMGAVRAAETEESEEDEEHDEEEEEQEMEVVEEEPAV